MDAMKSEHLVYSETTGMYKTTPTLLKRNQSVKTKLCNVGPWRESTVLNAVYKTYDVMTPENSLE